MCQTCGPTTKPAALPARHQRGRRTDAGHRVRNKAGLPDIRLPQVKLSSHPYQFQHFPEARVVRERELGVDPEVLVTEFPIAEVVESAPARVLLQVEPRERRGREEGFESVAHFQLVMSEEYGRCVGERGVLLGAVDLRLDERRFGFVRPAAGRQEVGLVAVPTAAVAATRIAGVEPEGEAGH